MTSDFAGHRVQVTRNPGPSQRSWDYTYDKIGNLSTEITPCDPQPACRGSHMTSMVYDALDRVVSKNLAPRTSSRPITSCSDRRASPSATTTEPTRPAGSRSGGRTDPRLPSVHKRRFNDKYQDDISGLTYYGARYYDKLLMNWTQADPLYLRIPELGSQSTPRRSNVAAFSLNNPIRYVDPDGRSPVGELVTKVVRNPATTAAIIETGIVSAEISRRVRLRWPQAPRRWFRAWLRLPAHLASLWGWRSSRLLQGTRRCQIWSSHSFSTQRQRLTSPAVLEGQEDQKRQARQERSCREQTSPLFDFPRLNRAPEISRNGSPSPGGEAKFRWRRMLPTCQTNNGHVFPLSLILSNYHPGQTGSSYRRAAEAAGNRGVVRQPMRTAMAVSPMTRSQRGCATSSNKKCAPTVSAQHPRARVVFPFQTSASVR